METVSICVFVNSSATKIFINYSLIEKHYLNICKPIFIYNINGTPNKDNQISEIVNIML